MVTARPPRHRSLAAPARFAARWRDLAACRDTDLELFFPERGESAGPARQVCAACPVRQPCLDYAITNRIAYGVWGGLTERERRALQSRWVRASRRNRDGAISAAVAAGYTVVAVGRSSGLARNVSRPKLSMPALPEYGRLSDTYSGRPDATIPLHAAVAYSHGQG